MEINRFIKLLEKYRFLSPIWKYEINLLQKEFKLSDNLSKIILIYFSLIDDGNIAMSLNKDELTKKIVKKIDSIKIELEEKEGKKDNFNEDEYKELSDELISVIEIELVKNRGEIIGFLNENDGLFKIEDEYLYTSKFFENRKDIIESIRRIFHKANGDYEDTIEDYLDSNENKFDLKKKQEEVIKKGLNSSLIITGGPGTGKTTTILFLLIDLLCNDEFIDYKIYLTAPTGKASSRMKEAINEGLKNNIKEKFKENNMEIIAKIEQSESSTIHKLLGFKDEGFLYNKENQFDEKSIFVIDEASMIDINVFASLLNAINSNSRVYILGDKNQLPSVEDGAVFTELVNDNYLQDFKVELDESNRFKEGSLVYELAEAINLNKELPIKKEDFKDPNDFEIEENNNGNFPIYYYLNDGEKGEKDMISQVISKWANYFYLDKYGDILEISCKNVDIKDKDLLDRIYEINNNCKILCATNEGNKGVDNINKLIVKTLYSDLDSYNKYYPGQILMITKNNNLLSLSNGETGVVVLLKDNKTLYLMIKKDNSSETNKNEESLILSSFGYKFYPLSLINEKEITLAYAITIHKSQGEGYKNILLILPTKKGHPLLVKQLIYTAITRTKGNTYILGNLDRLEEAKKNPIVRDTNIANKIKV